MLKSFLIVCLLAAFTRSNIIAQFLVNRMDAEDQIETPPDDDRFLFKTEKLSDDPNFLPTLGNGHVGFTVFSGEVLMNGLYNGKKGLSHRASIPNFGHVFMKDCDEMDCKYTFDARRGLFSAELTVENEFKATHFVYAHRFHTRAIVNQIYIERLESEAEILRPSMSFFKGFYRDDINLKLNSKNFESFLTTPDGSDSVDLSFVRNETITIDGQKFNLVEGRIKEFENDQKALSDRRTNKDQQEEVFVIWSQIPDEITLEVDDDSKMFTFIMAVDSEEKLAVQEVTDILRIDGNELLERHASQWKTFWKEFQIDGKGDNDDLIRAIISSVFYLTSSLPFEKSNLKLHPFYGLSPTGLGRGSSLTDYEGHSMWDSEMWMLPPAALINPDWAKQLLHYRFIMLEAAKKYAIDTGYRGARFPWESAATGIEVIQPGYEYIAEYQQHISADISFALRFYTSLTHDKEFLESEGCQLATAIAEFWASRVEFNERTKLYDINHVMGPDEDHSNVSNNCYTNVIAKHALNFGWFAQYVCNQTELNDEWLKISEKIAVLYDSELDYHPQFTGYNVGTEIKQADVILSSYPLMYPFSQSSMLNDLEFYSNVTRDDGPAMSFSMYAIGYLDASDEENANKMLKRSFEPYIRQPFNVWSELNDSVDEEEGAVNFVTGAGGFLQLIFNGFFGIRVHPKHLEIKNPRLPENHTVFSVKGFSYLNSKFQLEILAGETILNFHQLADELNIQLKGKKLIRIEENVSYCIPATASCIVSPSVDIFEKCEIKDIK